MPNDLMDILNTLIGSCKIKVTEERTAILKQGITDISDPSRIASCVRAFLSYYPEESLIEFCLDSLFINARPDRLSGHKHNIWIREVTKLAEAIKSFRVPKWELVMYRKMKFYCPQLVDEIWQDAVPSS